MHKAFYILNPSKSHSWMFILNSILIKHPVPYWFFKWWDYKGATISLLPPELKTSYNIWVESSPHLQQVTELWTVIIVPDKNKQIEKVIQNNLLKTQRSSAKWPEAFEEGPSQRPGKQIMQEEDSFI
ncbi:hypothetical protein M5K25_017916 [Dendrobium thyrsiflorum]|uniref:Uncharacterized protein n=1 Tax=Dendrobium thyrsiflorum TaxID=117978 RepID=A0ABD0UNN6_DENTH